MTNLRTCFPSLGLSLLLPVLFSCSAPGTKEPGAFENEKPLIEKVIYNNIAWALTKDTALMKSTVLQDESLFIFNPDSVPTKGWSELARNFEFWLDPRFRVTKTEIRDLRVHIAGCGTVAWWSCILDDLGEWDGRPIGWKNARWTGVLEKTEGQWRIAQMHFSLAWKP